MEVWQLKKDVHLRVSHLSVILVGNKVWLSIACFMGREITLISSSPVALLDALSA